LTLKVIFTILISLLLIALAVFNFMVKYNKLIAGYNMASDVLCDKIDIRRLRLLMAITYSIGILFVGSMPFITKDSSLVVNAMIAQMVYCLITVVLANNWAKKK